MIIKIEDNDKGVTVVEEPYTEDEREASKPNPELVCSESVPTPKTFLFCNVPVKNAPLDFVEFAKPFDQVVVLISPRTPVIFGNPASFLIPDDYKSGG